MKHVPGPQIIQFADAIAERCSTGREIEVPRRKPASMQKIAWPLTRGILSEYTKPLFRVCGTW